VCSLILYLLLPLCSVLRPLVLPAWLPRAAVQKQVWQWWFVFCCTGSGPAPHPAPGPAGCVSMLPATALRSRGGGCQPAFRNRKGAGLSSPPALKQALTVLSGCSDPKSSGPDLLLHCLVWKAPEHGKHTAVPSGTQSLCFYRIFFKKCLYFLGCLHPFGFFLFLLPSGYCVFKVGRVQQRVNLSCHLNWKWCGLRV
jgi:hypothetical protein